jgi:hypothetical protein
VFKNAGAGVHKAFVGPVGTRTICMHVLGGCGRVIAEAGRVRTRNPYPL